MFFEYMFSPKRFPTDLTTVRFLSSMNSLMLFHIKRISEGLVTIAAKAFLDPSTDGYICSGALA